jgi:sRNA-binding carbon storage regulator CsrA
MTVLEISPTGVRLGFEAPKIVEIMREEISAKHLNRPERKTGT